MILFTAIFAFGQEKKEGLNIADTSNIEFRDTLFQVVVDSLSHDLGSIVPTNENSRLMKHFKYIGTTPLLITKTWTNDPHFICDYPKEVLIPDKIYSITVCFWHKGKKGRMSKKMGFILSNGNKISFTFTGTYLPL